MADLFVWSNDYSVNVETIDEQHQQLLARINGFLHSVQSGEGQEHVQSTVNFLVAYVDIHFRTEEYFMKKHAYPGYATHKSEHERLSNAVLSIAQGISDIRPSRGVVTQLVTEMGTWILEHVQKMDKTLGRFLMSLGGKLDTRIPDDLAAILKGLPMPNSSETKDKICPYMDHCSQMFAGFLDKESKIFWQERFCLALDRRAECRRKHELDAGPRTDEVLRTMLPNGDRLLHLGS